MDGEAQVPSSAVAADADTVAAAAMDDADIDMNEVEAPSAGQTEPSKKEVKLDELFADDDSDDEFPSSAPVKREAVSSPARAASPSYALFVV